MSYIKPENVDAPKKHWELDCIVYDEGEEGIAIACGGVGMAIKCWE